MTFQSRLGFVRCHQTHVNKFQPCNSQQREGQICRYFWGGPDLSFCEIEYHQGILCSPYCGLNILALSVFSLVASPILIHEHTYLKLLKWFRWQPQIIWQRGSRSRGLPVNLHCINDPSLALAMNRPLHGLTCFSIIRLVAHCRGGISHFAKLSRNMLTDHWSLTTTLVSLQCI